MWHDMVVPLFPMRVDPAPCLSEFMSALWTEEPTWFTANGLLNSTRRYRRRSLRLPDLLGYRPEGRNAELSPLPCTWSRSDQDLHDRCIASLQDLPGLQRCAVHDDEHDHVAVGIQLDAPNTQNDKMPYAGSLAATTGLRQSHLRGDPTTRALGRSISEIRFLVIPEAGFDFQHFPNRSLVVPLE